MTNQKKNKILYYIIAGLVVLNVFQLLQPSETKIITKRDYSFERFLQEEIDSLKKEVAQKDTIFIEVEKEKTELKKKDDAIKILTDTADTHVLDSIIRANL